MLNYLDTAGIRRQKTNKRLASKIQRTRVPTGYRRIRCVYYGRQLNTS